MNGGGVESRWGLVIGIAAMLATATPANAEDEPESAPPIAAVQALLRQERLYTGPVDGAPSLATTAAVRRYQILHGLRATGLLDEPTLRAMLAPAPLSKALTDSDRELLRELSETPLPEPVAEPRREPIPPGPPVFAPTPEPTPKSKRTARPEKASRSKPVRPSRSSSSATVGGD